MDQDRRNPIVRRSDITAAARMNDIKVVSCNSEYGHGANVRVMANCAARYAKSQLESALW